MGRLIAIFWDVALLLLKAGGFLLKIIFSWFFKCASEIYGAMREEWVHREVDEETY